VNMTELPLNVFIVVAMFQVLYRPIRHWSQELPYD
jgi:hypothetical protein